MTLTMVSSMVCLPRRRGGDGQEILGYEGRAPDQAAIHVGPREQLGRVGGLDAAAVQDRQRAGDCSIVGSQLATDEGVHLLGLLRAGGAAGADGPDRLV